MEQVSAKGVAAVLLLMMVVTQVGAAGEEAVGEEKKACKYKSEKFWGICITDSKCIEVCRREGFQTGDCKGLRRRCYCVNNC